eukprot:scaffold108734_cov42-Prasinocladus_malaysianus.AAC.1
MATSQPAQVLHATENVAEETRNQFEAFLETFKPDDEADELSQGGSQSVGGDPTGLYVQQIALMVDDEDTTLQIDFEHIN